MSQASPLDSKPWVITNLISHFWVLEAQHQEQAGAGMHGP